GGRRDAAVPARGRAPVRVGQLRGVARDRRRARAARRGVAAPADDLGARPRRRPGGIRRPHVRWARGARGRLARRPSRPACAGDAADPEVPAFLARSASDFGIPTLLEAERPRYEPVLAAFAAGSTLDELARGPDAQLVRELKAAVFGPFYALPDNPNWHALG